MLDPLLLQVQQDRAFSFYDIHRDYLHHMMWLTHTVEIAAFPNSNSAQIVDSLRVHRCRADAQHTRNQTRNRCHRGSSNNGRPLLSPQLATERERERENVQASIHLSWPPQIFDRLGGGSYTTTKNFRKMLWLAARLPPAPNSHQMLTL